MRVITITEVIFHICYSHPELQGSRVLQGSHQACDARRGKISNTAERDAHRFVAADSTNEESPSTRYSNAQEDVPSSEARAWDLYAHGRIGCCVDVAASFPVPDHGGFPLERSVHLYTRCYDFTTRYEWDNRAGGNL